MGHPPATKTMAPTPTKDEVDMNFYEPNPGFKALLSKWKDQEDKSKNTSQDFATKAARRKSRVEAKKEVELRKRSGELDKSAAKRNHRMPKNVYQQPVTFQAGFRPPVFTRNFKEQEVIRAALSKNFVFSDLSDRDLKPLVLAFESCEFQTNDIVIKQGDPGDYFYIIQSGQVTFDVNGVAVGKAGKGASFGELALLYTCPRAATVVASQDSKLFRVDQMTFRFILESQTKQSEKDKTALLQGVNFLQDLTSVDLKKLSSVMTPRVFKKEELLVRKGDMGDAFYVLQEGQVLVKDISVGSTKYEDQTLSAGDYFGERSLATSEPRAANVVGLTPGIAFSIDRDTFEKVLGSMSSLVLRAQDARKLAGVRIMQRASLEMRELAALAAMMSDHSYRAGKNFIKRGEKKKAAICFVREGRVQLKSDTRDEIVEAGGFFGEDLMVEACANPKTTVAIPYDVIALEDSTCAVLTLKDCRTVFDTKAIAQDKEPFSDECDERDEEVEDLPNHSVRKTNARLNDLKRHKILGEGTFGQVWLVSEDLPDGTHQAYALKMQSKHDLAEEGQIKAVIREKDIMLKLNHPFIIDLIKTYQDEKLIYILLDFIQGGELFSIMHEEENGLDEGQAKFYAKCIADALAYLHRSKIVFRDLKPENVMVENSGYPKLIDFGFAKHVPEKTYTLCGTPGYLPPEVVMTRGHDCSADHWTLGILIYEMVTGENPFYYEGMDQMSLFQSIVEDDYEPPTGVGAEAADITAKLLVKDPSHRLGSLARGENDILEHSWFSDLELAALRRKELAAPWKPSVKDPLDTGCFDDWTELEDMSARRFPALKEKDAVLFEGF